MSRAFHVSLKWNFIEFSIVLILLVMTSTFNVQTNTSHLQQAETKFIISSYAKTQYPIVFAHALLGFNRLATENLAMDYWYQILPDLARNGSTTFATRMSPFNSSELRGEQYAAQLLEILAITGTKNSI